MLVIGVDCATQANKTGMVLASWSGAALRFEDAAIGSKRNPCLKVLSWWIGRDPDVLLALDAPLGWPEPLGSALATHSAGKVISEDADDLFSRTTDRRIRERLGKRPFEVGANLIARTAHAALKMLEALRRATGHSIPLVWEGEDFSGVGAIEVYPAATRIAHGFAKSPTPLNGLKERMEGDFPAWAQIRTSWMPRGAPSPERTSSPASPRPQLQRIGIYPGAKDGSGFARANLRQEGSTG